MNQRLREVWLPGLCFIVSFGAGLVLLGSVLVIPWFADETSEHPLIVLYARDATVRRTSIAAGFGLIATAFVFFRPAGFFRKNVAKPDAPSNFAGA